MTAKWQTVLSYCESARDAVHLGQYELCAEWLHKARSMARPLYGPNVIMERLDELCTIATMRATQDHNKRDFPEY